MPLRNSLELFDRNSRAKFLMSAPKPKQREVRSGSNNVGLALGCKLPVRPYELTCGCTASTEAMVQQPKCE
jgi:hypothetical protein